MKRVHDPRRFLGVIGEILSYPPIPVKRMIFCSLTIFEPDYLNNNIIEIGFH